MHEEPEQGMEMRALLAIVLSMGLLALYQVLFVPAAPPPPAEPGVESGVDAGVAAGEPSVSPDAAPPEREELTTAGAAEAPTETVVAAADARNVRVEANGYSALVTNRGARLRSLVLRDYQGISAPELDLVHPRAAAADRLPLELVSASRGAELPSNSALYAVDVSGGRRSGDAWVASREAPVTVRLEWADGAGWRVLKELVFAADGSQVQVRVRASAADGEPLFIALGPGLDRVPQDSRNTFLAEQAVALAQDESLMHWPPAAGQPPEIIPLSPRWAGVESFYFLSAFLLDAPTEVRVESIEVPGTPGSEDDVAPLARLAVRIPTGGLDAPLYMGPKRYDTLTQQGYGLRRAVDFGFFGILARPMLALLVWIHSFVGNYGVSIILLTVLLRVVFLPLNHKAMTSMRKMQGLQPQMAAIRARYAGAKDMEKRQQMNEEVMALYRREGVSPFGGCLPMLAQLPILFAFYRLLSVAVELRQAPFALWVHDLSQADPYLVLPLLMGGSMLVQQRMTPSAGMNPSQARMMNLMPIVFTLLFLSVPSGLVLYWLVNNLLGIAQQVYVNRQIGGDSAKGSATKASPKGQRGKKR